MRYHCVKYDRKIKSPYRRRDCYLTQGKEFPGCIWSDDKMVVDRVREDGSHIWITSVTQCEYLREFE